VVELNGNAQKLQDALKKLQGDFSNISSSPEIDKIFAKLETSLNAILRKTSKGIIPREDFLASEKELKKVKSGMDSLYSTIEGFKKLSDKKLLSMVPDDTKAKLTEANNAFIAYSATVEKVIKAEEKLAEAQKKKEAAQL
jgi:soluble cytochrome b562